MSLTRPEDENTAADSGEQADAAHPRLRLWIWAVATFWGTGYMRPGPGSWASAATLVLWWVLTRWLPTSWQVQSALVLIALAVASGIPAATYVSRQTGLKDPQRVVIDEVAGQLISVLATPVSWKTLLVGFILFRAFDITKPPPVRQLEKLPEGIGIVVDDLGAGMYALIVMQLLLHFGMLR